MEKSQRRRSESDEVPALRERCHGSIGDYTKLPQGSLRWALKRHSWATVISTPVNVRKCEFSFIDLKMASNGKLFFPRGAISTAFQCSPADAV